jgi:site-specific DNA recombinase
MKAAICTRLSNADENSTSTKRQETECREYASRHDLEVVEVFVDEGISGYKDVERPAFDEAVDNLARGEFDVLIAWKLDRLSRRGMGQVGAILDKLENTGRKIVTVVDGVDTSQATGRLMIGLLAEMARSESVNTSVRPKAQRREAREKGRISVGSPPWGMTRREDGSYVPDLETGPIAREVLDRVLAGEATINLVRWLNSNGHFTTRGNYWTQAALSRWMHFPTLARMVPYNPGKRRHQDLSRS